MIARYSLHAGILVCAWMFLVATCRAESPDVNGEPVLQANGSVRFAIQGEFRPSLASARESALQMAQERLREWLARQNPSIRHVPSLDTIRREMVHREDPPQQEQILNQKDTMYKISMEVDFQPKHVRALRERDRIVTGMWTLGALLAILGLAALIFRVDEWTKGYLTRWLIAAGIGAVVALVAAWWFVR